MCCEFCFCPWNSNSVIESKWILMPMEAPAVACQNNWVAWFYLSLFQVQICWAMYNDNIKSCYSLWSIGHRWRASRHCGLQLSPWPRSMIYLCFLSHPLLSFAAFSSACLFCIPEDFNLMQFSLLLLFLYVMCVQSNSIFFFLSDFLLTSDGWFSIVIRS